MTSDTITTKVFRTVQLLDQRDCGRLRRVEISCGTPPPSDPLHSLLGRKKRRMFKKKKMKQCTFVIMNIIVKHSLSPSAPTTTPILYHTSALEFATSKSSLLRVTPIIRGSFKKVKIGETPTMS